MLSKTDAPTLLLIEDDEDDGYFFIRKFRQSGLPYALRHLSNGGAAIEYLLSAAATGALPKAIFLDLKMPVLNGFDVLAWLQTQHFSAPMPVFVLSGSEQKTDIDRARKLGATDYLVKPVAVEDLNRCLQGLPSWPGAPSLSGKGSHS